MTLQALIYAKNYWCRSHLQMVLLARKLEQICLFERKFSVCCYLHEHTKSYHRSLYQNLKRSAWTCRTASAEDSCSLLTPHTSGPAQEPTQVSQQKRAEAPDTQRRRSRDTTALTESRAGVTWAPPYPVKSCKLRKACSCKCPDGIRLLTCPLGRSFYLHRESQACHPAH